MFRQILDYAVTSQNLDNVLLISQVFPVAGYASVQGLLQPSDLPVSNDCPTDADLPKLCPRKYADNTEALDDLHKSHLAARVSLLQRLADWTITYAHYAKQPMCSEGSWKRIISKDT